MVYKFTCSYMRREVSSVELWKAVLAEFLGTFMLISFNMNNGMNKNTDGSPDLRFALGCGMALLVLIECFVHISGGHMNPAISVSFLITHRISVLRAFLYIIAQSVGSVAAVLSWSNSLGEPFASTIVGPSLHPSISLVQGVFVELYITFALVLVTLGAIDERFKSVYMPVIHIGLTVTVAILSFGRYTGATMNPVIALGPAVHTGNWSIQWVYWVGPLGGSVVASVLYEFMFIWKLKTVQEPIREGEDSDFSVDSNHNEISVDSGTSRPHMMKHTAGCEQRNNGCTVSQL